MVVFRKFCNEWTSHLAKNPVGIKRDFCWHVIYLIFGLPSKSPNQE